MIGPVGPCACMLQFVTRAKSTKYTYTEILFVSEMTQYVSLK